MVSLIIVGFGNVGRSLADIMLKDREYLHKTFGFNSEIRAICELKGALINKSGIDVDDNNSMGIIRLFNEPIGQKYLSKKGVPAEIIEKLPLMGISSVANMIMAIKFAKYYELTEKDIVLTVFTDSMEMYSSRLKELKEEFGPYDETDAAIDFHRNLQALTTDYMQELTYRDKKRIHNLKYFTWIEQQGKDMEELNAQWYDSENYWGNIHRQVGKINELIEKFNQRTGLLK